ncbi:MAG: hypothetical protein K1X94_23655 [Sandaracinaceae bacterium]|jgi:hypothetical protein|nr:hypothetical protein [Sandaracinaceae bacterium]
MSEREAIARIVSSETLVDRARAAVSPTQVREWCTRAAHDKDARAELTLMDAFDEDTAVTSRSHHLRVELAVEGALATLEDEDCP